MKHFWFTGGFSFDLKIVHKSIWYEQPLNRGNPLNPHMNKYLASQRPSDWFEPLYAKAAGNSAQIPWALMQATPCLQQWLQTTTSEQTTTNKERSAVVIGCGLGDDAEALAQAGFVVTAFDISSTAIKWARERFPKSTVNYEVADLFRLPSHWYRTFDLVFEFRTIQALPLAVRKQAIEQIASLVAAQGTLLVATYLRPDNETDPDGPPWPLTVAELTYFEAQGLTVVNQQGFTKRNSRFNQRMQIEYCFK